MPLKDAATTEDRDRSEEPEAPSSKIVYEDGLEYWRLVPATLDGVLGGFGESTPVPKKDISGLVAFLKKLSSRMRPAKDEVKYGIEMGAGIGRVTKNLLGKYCDKVDLVEYNEKAVAQMDVELADLIKEGKIGNIYNCGMQYFKDKVPEDQQYWLVWCQWCLGYLTDELLVEFLQFLASRLSPNGTIIVKENVCVNLYNEDLFDDLDSSVTRTDASFKLIFSQSGLKLIAQETQKGLPKELFPVKMYALKRAS